MLHNHCIPPGDAETERLPCMVATADAIELSNRVAFTSLHPARVRAEKMIQHLTAGERRRLEVRQHTLALVIGRGVAVCSCTPGGAVHDDGRLCSQGRAVEASRAGG